MPIQNSSFCPVFCPVLSLERLNSIMLNPIPSTTLATVNCVCFGPSTVTATRP